MNLDQILSELKAERDRIDQAITALSGIRERASYAKGTQSGNISRQRSRRRMSAATRKRMSEQMKKRWAERKRAAAKAR